MQMKIVSALLLFFILGCSNDGSHNDIVGRKGSSTAYEMAEVNDGVSENNPIEEQKIIKTARLVFETKDVEATQDRKSTRLNSSHVRISYAVFCLKKKNKQNTQKERHVRNTAP